MLVWRGANIGDGMLWVLFRSSLGYLCESEEVGDLLGHTLVAERGQVGKIGCGPVPADDTGEESLGDYRNAKRPCHSTLDSRVLNVPREDRQFQQNYRSIGTDDLPERRVRSFRNCSAGVGAKRSSIPDSYLVDFELITSISRRIPWRPG